MNSSALAQCPSVTVRGQFSEKSSFAARTKRMAAAPKKMRLSASAATGVEVKDVPTTPIEGQKTGTSGLRKKAAVFSEGNYLANWVQSLFLALPQEEVDGSAMVLGGDGRWFNKEASQIIIKLAAGNGVRKMYVGQNGFLATPAASAVIRARKAYGGFIMSASHNPGGPKEDWGIKFNYSSGEPAPEKITDKIYGFTQTVDTLKMADIPDVDLSKVGVTKFGDFEVEVIDPVADYLELAREVFDFDLIKSLVTRSDFKMKFDAMHAITGAYAKPILVDVLGADPSSCVNDDPKEDFAGGHPDPNLTYAEELVKTMYSADAPDFGAASDGDGDRNMILGNNFFVTPSDSVAIIAANAKCIPYFKDGLKGLARSMPTAAALDRVAAKMGVECFETPTGWKFFGNLMDAGRLSVCGEESFGTGSDHIREKDGPWAVLAWLSILADRNKDVPVGGEKVTVEQITKEHWAEYGRNFFSRYDYEGCESEPCEKMVEHLRTVAAASKKGDKYGEYELDYADDFEYTDPIDGSVASKQGVRFVFSDGSRFIFRLSGTGSSGATVRMYIEQYEADVAKQGADAQDALAPLIKVALETSKLAEFTGRESPTVIT
jgi:phosphoglucomutase|mmetsp:Transcript_2580/g.10778  ORF Transcript_2580/g.10778 Transcript_2580/m.10778 type:complete len:604 (-) Transcript_2580:115-1926(-)|eukprot:CAMPEP_0203005164 /NCGR_PEP_ID=MMETSP1401-20130829/2801_1 /ASSEMBLY_ACC=CAM_ASM_000894 /TAXON_ID=38833 /ORGANISM="Micromonas pusilla, Strain CCAC1681" /LENGTH=603 /DNA_ID=CAMNT_0049746785 /DNA_START=73 /DNA_END=1884 /DNA_ORIENTATION=+